MGIVLQEVKPMITHGDHYVRSLSCIEQSGLANLIQDLISAFVNNGEALWPKGKVMGRQYSHHFKHLT